MTRLLQALILTALCSLSYQQTCTHHDNHDIDLPDLAAVHWKEVWQCCDVCKQTNGCKGYSWNNYEGGTCWLKAGTGPIVWKEAVLAGVLDGAPPEDGIITFSEFQNGVINSNNCPAPSQAQYNAFILGLPKSGITTKQEAAMALTQYSHESDCLRAKREYACEHTGCPGDYETPGCDVWGQRYYGRGYIQLTWCGNYNAASWALFGDGRLVNDPDMVAREETVAWDAAFWYWATRVHGQWGVAEGMFGVTTRAINGGLECDGAFQHIARHRFEMYKRVRQAFGLSGNADERGCYN